MDNDNKDWLNSANSYRPVEGANRLADEINDAMQELKLGNVENLDDWLARLWSLRGKCLELAPLTEDAPTPKPIRRADGTGVNPMGVGNEWGWASQNIDFVSDRLSAGEALTEEFLENISQLAYSAASRSVRREGRDSGG
jgi:hypothetical protein